MTASDKVALWRPPLAPGHVKVRIVPSVTLAIDIPEDRGASASFYRGKPVVVLRDSIFEASEAHKSLVEQPEEKHHRRCHHPPQNVDRASD